ncbi:hypothetical protein, partial [Acaricomes phytoseiuli]|uniref:hypothetical protein n=1 Tax=Acaricomes phytoseiuli TaxID=291968 RepID=UPI001B7FB573
GFTGHSHDIVTELFRIGLGQEIHPSSEDESSQIRCQPNPGQTLSLGSSLFTSGVLLLSSVVSAGVGTGLYAESSAVVQEDLAQSITWGYAKKM